jgi:hypothetical protein
MQADQLLRCKPGGRPAPHTLHRATRRNCHCQQRRRLRRCVCVYVLGTTTTPHPTREVVANFADVATIGNPYIPITYGRGLSPFRKGNTIDHNQIALQVQETSVIHISAAGSCRYLQTPTEMARFPYLSRPDLFLTTRGDSLHSLTPS